MPWNLAYIGFRGLRVYWHCPFSFAIQAEDMAAILILSLILYYWHNVLEAVLSDLSIFRITASAEGCLSACTVFLQNIMGHGTKPYINFILCIAVTYTSINVTQSPIPNLSLSLILLTAR